MVNFQLTDEQKDMQELFRKFAQEQIAPIAEEMDEKEEMNMDMVKKMMELGFFGVPFSEEVGGTGMDYLTYCLLMEEVVCASIIEQYATPEQKEKWLRPLVDGSKIGCFGLTEPNAGSDVAGAVTTAEKDGDYYVINGSKIFTTNSGFADTFLVFALTDKSLPAHKGMSAFMVDRNTPGLEVQPDIKRMGIRAASNAEVYYNNVRVVSVSLHSLSVLHRVLSMQPSNTAKSVNSLASPSLLSRTPSSVWLKIRPTSMPLVS